jgi:hypothetical protein
MNPRIVTSREEIVAVLRERRDELNISHETIDAVAGWADGYASKIFAPTPMKNLGPTSLAAILGALALGIARVVLIEDPEQAARVSSRWTQRKRKTSPRCVVSSQLSFTLTGSTEETTYHVEKPIDHDAHRR